METPKSGNARKAVVKQPQRKHLPLAEQHATVRTHAKMGGMRIQAVFSRWSIPIWAWLAWELIGVLHEGKFVGELLPDINRFSQEHVIGSFLIGLGALFVFALWPEYIKPWWPSWLIYKPLHDKLHDLSLKHADLNTEVSSLGQGAIEILKVTNLFNTALNTKIDDLRKGFSEMLASTNATVAALSTDLHRHRETFERFSDNASGLFTSIQNSVNGLDSRVASVEEATKSIRANLITQSKDVHGTYMLISLDLTQLMSEASALVEGLMTITKLSPTSRAARLPFSNDWSETEPSIEGEWAMNVKAHVLHCRNFCKNYGVAEPLVIDSGFLDQLWTSQAPTGQCLSWLTVQWERLLRLRRTTIMADA